MNATRTVAIDRDLSCRDDHPTSPLADGRPPACCYCGSEPVLRDTTFKWRGVEPKPMWFCGAFPGCDSYVRCHDGGTTAMGTLAGPRLRKLRSSAHRAFDSLWEHGGSMIGRTMAYVVAGQVMGIADLHIGHLNEDQCVRLLDSIDLIDDALSEHAEALLNPVAEVDDLVLDVLHTVFWGEDQAALAPSVAAADLTYLGAIACQVIAAGLVVLADGVDGCPSTALLTSKGRRVLEHPG